MSKVKKLGVMLDCSRNAVPNVETLKSFIRIIKKMGYNHLELYTEDTYHIANRPYFGYLRGRYTVEELKEIDAFATQKGVELSPAIQVLAHLLTIFRWPCFYKTVSDFEDILLCDEPETYKLIEDMFSSLAKSYSSREVNIGCDEADMVGLGKYLSRFGFKDRFDIINRHVARVIDIADKYGFKCSMWSDMYFRLAFGGEYWTDKPIPKDVLEKVPKKLTLIYWDYYSTDINHYRKMFAAHKRFGREVEFAGGAWKWTGFAPDNAYSIKTANASVPAALKAGINKLMITAWGDNGGEASIFSVLPALYHFARLAKGKNPSSSEIEKGFQRIVGVSYNDFLDIERINMLKWNDKEKVPNTDKYFLYNDLFSGYLDDWLNGGESKHYVEVASRLKNGKYGKYSYIFKTMEALADVLSLKADMGKRTRELYKANDRQGLKALTKEYDELVRRISLFIRIYTQQWMRENKPHGFEVQDLRLGGLIQRIKTCKKRLLDFLSGRLKSISELEDEILPFIHGDWLNNYRQIVSVNPI